MILFKRKPKEIKEDITTIDFHTMLRHYDVYSSNIAVMRNKKSFKNVLKHYRKCLRPIRDDKVIKISEDKYVFIIDDVDITIEYIENVSDLDKEKIKFRKIYLED